VFSLIAGAQFKHLLSVVSLGNKFFDAAFVITIVVFETSGKQNGLFNMLWSLVFGFATLNILGLVARRFEPNRNRMNFGELVAVMTVVLSVFLLGWEMLTVFKILPIRLSTH